MWPTYLLGPAHPAGAEARPLASKPGVAAEKSRYGWILRGRGLLRLTKFQGPFRYPSVDVRWKVGAWS